VELLVAAETVIDSLDERGGLTTKVLPCCRVTSLLHCVEQAFLDTHSFNKVIAYGSQSFRNLIVPPRSPNITFCLVDDLPDPNRVLN
jgi:hypothetical protein